MKLFKRLFAKHKVLKIILLLLAACIILAVTAFFVLRANSFQLMCHAYKIDTEYHLYILDEDIVNGVETRIIHAHLASGSPIWEYSWNTFRFITARCEKNEWGFWELVDYNHLLAYGLTEYSWSYPAGYACVAYNEEVEQYEYHSYYTFGKPYDVAVEFLPGQVPENVSASLTYIPGAFCVAHISYVATEPIDFDAISLLQENGMVGTIYWEELDESLFGRDLESMTEDERLELITQLQDVYMSGISDEDNARVKAEMERLGVEFLTDEQVKEKFPEAYYGMAGAELSANVVFKRLLLALMIAIPLIVIAIPFVIGPLAAKHRRKKEARQAENAQDI